MKIVQKNLVIIDYQNDFVELDGKLTCGQSAIDIEKNIIALIDDYKNENIFVTYDTHYENQWEDGKETNEAKVFPKHCIFETKGHSLYGKLEDKLSDTKYESIYKNSFATEKLVKAILLKNDPNMPIDVKFCGVATNICVFQNVIMLYNYFVQNNIKFSISIDENAVASFDDELERQSLEYLKNTLGVIVK